MVNIVALAKIMISFVKDKNGQENLMNPDPRNEGVSLIFWLVNYASKKREHRVGHLNPHSILEIIMLLLPKTNNLLVMESLMSFIKLLF